MVEHILAILALLDQKVFRGHTDRPQLFVRDFYRLLSLLDWVGIPNIIWLLALVLVNILGILPLLILGILVPRWIGLASLKHPIGVGCDSEHHEKEAVNV